MKRRVTGNGLRIRGSAGLSGRIIGSLGTDDIVEQTGDPVDIDGYYWGNITTQAGLVGWVALKYTEEMMETIEKRQVVVPALRQRREPDLSAEIIQNLKGGEIVQVLDVEPVMNDGFEWGLVVDPYGVEGWTAIKFTQTVSDFRFEIWPTQYKKITQAFGANPDYYSQFGLAGHEGIDIRAPHDSEIRVVADGIVSRVYTDPRPRNQGGHNYGIHVRVKHIGGEYETIYAHMVQALVEPGQEIKAGHLIGRADNTGNSFGSHLHLTLKRWGTIIDPTPFIAHLMS